MAAIGLVSGVGGGKFDPNATMTQEEFITVLGRLVEFVNLDAREFLDKNPLAIFAAAAEVQELFTLGHPQRGAFDEFRVR
ncbi:MAG: S-layer homology domain-containing protein [Oscillibacter sp.]